MMKNKMACVGIVGLGYVGLPLAVAFAKAGLRVIGVDTNEQRVQGVNSGVSYIGDVKDEEICCLPKNILRATTNQVDLQETDAIIICVPTPLTKNKEPDLSYVVNEAMMISKYLRHGQLVVLESTTYPGTTKDIVCPILEKSGLRAGIDFYLAYSPEMVDPGNKEHGIKNTPKVVGGIDGESTRQAILLYSHIIDKVEAVSCPEVAEMSKVFSNVFRSVNIALVNELAQLCQRMGISVWEVIDAVSLKPFGFMPFYPSIGVGGHCIPLDPYYLANKARELDFHTRFIELAAEINENMPRYVLGQIIKALNQRNRSIKESRILIVGIAYKRDVGDIRESPSLKLVELLEAEGAFVLYHDPYVPEYKGVRSIVLTDIELSMADCVVIATDHSCLNIERIVTKARLVFDARGVTRHLYSKYGNVVRLGE
jgi:UDP-N-acetyl-D-glucosamine dehydrogenase